MSWSSLEQTGSSPLPQVFTMFEKEDRTDKNIVAITFFNTSSTNALSSKNTGYLKKRMYCSHIIYILIPRQVIKKEKGNNWWEVGR